MNGLYEAADEAHRFFQARGWRYCIIGGLAVARWGQPRATQDVDISLFTGWGDEQSYIEPMLARFPSRIPDAARFAMENRVLLVKASNGVALDVALAAFPLEEEMIGRATPFRFAAGVELITVCAEDLIVLKAFAGRDIDWSDVGGVIIRQADRLDWDLVLSTLKSLCELNADG
ncbi:MAG: hypothetical protein GXP27_18255 [Planctomycetes bacterium]|nr:hypothetical protein [Planctomycetota bacterium]